MHSHTLEQWQHTHHFTQDSQQNEYRTRLVIGLTFTMMVVEIVAGSWFGSMALLADGWHMATHVAALSITAIAYWYARRHADNSRYSFGTGKVGVLGGFASAVALAVVALMMALESMQRFFMDVTIHFPEAIVVAVIGLAVNLVSAFLLRNDHDHHHHHSHHAHDHHDHHHEQHHDHNLRAAYMHVLADALTSLLAIIALVAGMFLGWVWLDAAMGIVGALVIARWSWELLRDTSDILLDSSVPLETIQSVQQAIEANADNRVADLHVWRVGAHHLAAIITVVTHYPQPSEYYKALLRDIPDLAHVSVEVQACPGEPCLPRTPATQA